MRSTHKEKPLFLKDQILFLGDYHTDKGNIHKNDRVA